MYLQTATTLDEITTFGIDPMIELMNVFEDEITEDLSPGSRESILWNLLKGQALRVQEVSRRVEEIGMKRAKVKRAAIKQ